MSHAPNSTNQRSLQNEEGWGVLLVVIILFILFSLSLAMARLGASHIRDLSSRDASHNDYWRANAFATDLEAGLRSDVVGAYYAEVKQARDKEASLDKKSRLLIFDSPGTTRSVPLMRFSNP